ncbi:MAG TPA: hypothetical protein PLC15_06835 [Candidatus Obscuribacter sp.]|nr:hypothetical protein [Candidatus Obscuribacter sp.]MBK9276621.1 hypothetical protein [Candidatus Obscuribacter sp.]MBL8083609.1 hypothetical protein [Candidatus Obscuribacter sp.]HMW91894.1 hypothetical protein [Candidatus Obscuribacter sp.]HMY03591.1 hypothetical protein [Candidatus Obscuribacter sp.]
MITKFASSSIVCSIALFCLAVTFLQSCVTKPVSNWIPRPVFFAYSLQRQLELQDFKSKADAAHESSTVSYLYAVVEHSFSAHTVLLVVYEDGTAVAADSKSPTGYSYWQMTESQFEEFKKDNSVLCDLKVKDYGSDISITDLPTTWFYLKDGSGRRQRIRIYGEFSNNQSLMNAQDRRCHCIVPDVLREAFRRSAEVRTSNSRVWAPENLCFVLKKSASASKASLSHAVRFEPRTVPGPLEDVFTVKKSDLTESEVNRLLTAYLEKRLIAIRDHLYALTLAN